jgi:hypothetical protein
MFPHMDWPSVRIAMRRTWRDVLAPQGVATGVIVAVLGLVVASPLSEGGVDLGTIMSLALSLLIWLATMFSVEIWRVVRGATVQRLELVGGQVAQAGKGWRIVGDQTDSGITFATMLTDPGATWPMSGRWVVTDPYGELHIVIIRTAIPPPPGSMAFHAFAQVTWPIDFGAVRYKGKHSVAWIVGGEEMASLDFTVIVHRGRARH